MPFPTVDDDGATVTLDLHGATLREAERLLKRCLRLAAARGRGTLRIIHGTSTAETDPHRPTIKSLVAEILARRETADYITERFRFEGHTTVSLIPGGDDIRTPIRMTELN